MNPDIPPIILPVLYRGPIFGVFMTQGGETFIFSLGACQTSPPTVQDMSQE